MALELYARTATGKAWRSLLSLLTVARADLIALIPTFGVGQRGLVPAPSAGEVTALEFLNADGTFRPLPGITVTLLESGSLSGATVDLVEDTAGLWATYRELLLNVTGESSDTAGLALLVRVSNNSGSSFAATLYQGVFLDGAASAANLTTSLVNGTSNTAAQTSIMALKLGGHQGGTYPQCNFSVLRSDGVSVIGIAAYNGSTTAVNALRLLLNGAGNFDAGTYTLVGIK